LPQAARVQFSLYHGEHPAFSVAAATRSFALFFRPIPNGEAFVLPILFGQWHWPKLTGRFALFVAGLAVCSFFPRCSRGGWPVSISLPTMFESPAGPKKKSIRARLEQGGHR